MIFATRNSFALFLCAIVSLLALFPVCQLIKNHGLVFYLNGLDEGAYLQYDFSQHVMQRAARFSQAAVSWLHELGLSGGWINFVFDLFVPLGSLILFRTVLRREPRLTLRPDAIVVLCVCGVLLLSRFNPLINSVFGVVIQERALRWLTMPEARLWPLLRTPEPQLSYLLAVLAVVCSVRLRSFIPLYAVAPLLYSFIALPWIFVVLSLELSRRLPERWGRYAPLAAFVAEGILLRVYFSYFVSDEARSLSLESGLPLISFCGVGSLLCYYFLRSSFIGRERTLVFVLALAPWAAANQQVLSGWVSVPSNIEQYSSALCLSFLLALWLTRACPGAVRYACVGVSALLFVHLAQLSRESFGWAREFPLQPEIKRYLQQDAHRVAPSEAKAGLLYNLVWPKQRATFFSHSQAYWGIAKDYVPQYLCAKQQIRRDPKLAVLMDSVLTRIEVMMRYESQDYYLNNLFRAPDQAEHFDLEAVPDWCPDLRLIFVGIGGDEITSDLPTPSRQRPAP